MLLSLRERMLLGAPRVVAVFERVAATFNAYELNKCRRNNMLSVGGRGATARLMSRFIV